MPSRDEIFKPHLQIGAFAIHRGVDDAGKSACLPHRPQTLWSAPGTVAVLACDSPADGDVELTGSGQI
jgi:hypothetical protein